MKNSLRLLAAGLLALAPFAAAAKIERTVEKSFTVQPGGTLTVSTQGGRISVEPSADGTLKVVAREKIRASSEAEADEILKKLDLAIEQHGNDVSATAKYESRPMGFQWGSWPPVQVEFIVTAPAGFSVDVKTSGGDITVGDRSGRIQARTSGGNIRLGKVTGEVEAHTSGGDVRLTECTGSAKLSTSGGNITAGRVGGTAELSTSGGDIKVESVAGQLRAATSGGNVTAKITGPLQGNCVLSTSGGDVKATVDASAGFVLDASTSGGSVDATGLTVTIEKGGAGRSRLAGKVNGGGPTLKLRSSGGGITVRAGSGAE